MTMKRFLTLLTLSAFLFLNAGRVLATSATADVVIDWSSLSFSSPVTWDLQESFVEIGLSGGYLSQTADGFVNLLQTGFDANSETLANTMDGIDAAFANVGTNGYGYAYSDLYGSFTPGRDMSLTIRFDYELFGEVDGNAAFSDSYVFLLLGDQAFDDFLTLSGMDWGGITGTASVTASLLAGQTYDFSMGASAMASTVPEPGAVWLLGMGLIGLAGLKRKRRKL
jgi:hypothetical protein